MMYSLIVRVLQKTYIFAKYRVCELFNFKIDNMRQITTSVGIKGM